MRLFSLPQFSGFAQQALGIEPKPAGENPVMDASKVLFSFDEFDFATTCTQRTPGPSLNHDLKVRMIQDAIVKELGAGNFKSAGERYAFFEDLGWRYTYTNRDLLIATWDREKASQLPLNKVLKKVRAQCPDVKFEIWLESFPEKDSIASKPSKQPRTKPQAPAQGVSANRDPLATEISKIKVRHEETKKINKQIKDTEKATRREKAGKDLESKWRLVRWVQSFKKD